MKKVKAFFDSGVTCFGDSITVGQGGSTSAHGWAARFARAVGGGINNQAVSGTGTFVATNAVMNMNNHRRGPMVYMAGFNDIRANGLVSLDKVKNNTRSAIACALLDKCVPASELVSFGTWYGLGGGAGGKAYAMSALPDHPGATGLYTNDPTAWLEWKFSGTNVVIGGITTNASGSMYRDLDIQIDGGAATIFSVSNLTDEAYGYVEKTIKGLSDGPHTIRIKPRSSSTWSVLDYVGTLAEPGARGSVLISHIPKMTDWTYAGYTLTPAIVDQVNAAIDGVVAEFADYPVATVPINTYYDPNNNVDGVHPNDSGHNQIYEGVIDYCKMWC